MKPKVITKGDGGKKEYHLSRKALAQRRRNSKARKGTGKDWVSVKVERDLKEKATQKDGCVNNTLAKKFRKGARNA